MIELKDVTKIYNYKSTKEVIALKNVNLTILNSSSVILKGPSGSGKSTLLSLIAGFTHPTFGKVVIDGKDISKMKESFLTLFRREKIGFIFQKFNLLEDLKLFDNLILPLIPTKIPYSEIEARANELLKRFHLHNKRDVLVRKLSGGEQQRVAIARALMNNPDIILADEPTANLDKALVFELFTILSELKQEKKTIIIATHDERFEHLDWIDRIYEVKQGNVVDA